MDKRTIGLAGGAVAALGVFLPFASFPIVGSINLLKGGEGDGVIILPLILVGLIAFFYSKYKFTTGIAAMTLVFMFYEISNTLMVIGQAKEEMSGSDDVFGFGAAMAQSISIEYGGFVVIAGLMMMMLASIGILNEDNAIS